MAASNNSQKDRERDDPSGS